MFKPFQFVFWGYMLLAMFVLGGCFGQNNTVSLTYDHTGTSVVPSSTSPRIVIVMFEDKRGRIDIGVHSDGSPFNPGSSVSTWVSQGMADELARLGAQVSFATSMAQAQSSKPDYIIDGSVDHVWLTEKNLSSYSCVIRIQTRMHGSESAVLTKKHSSQRDKVGIPGPRLYESTLSEALSDVASHAARSIMSSI